MFENNNIFYYVFCCDVHVEGPDLAVASPDLHIFMYFTTPGDFFKCYSTYCYIRVLFIVYLSITTQSVRQKKSIRGIQGKSQHHAQQRNESKQRTTILLVPPSPPPAPSNCSGEHFYIYSSVFPDGILGVRF